MSEIQQKEGIMKQTLRFAFSLLFFALLLPGSAGTLKGIYKPQMIRVFDDELFVVEGHRIFVYDLADLSLKTVIGKEGEGPGEFRLDPSRTLIISVFPDFIHAESRNKIVHFTRGGTFIKEIRKAPGILQALPIRENFVVHKILYGPGGKNYFTLNIYDGRMQEVKELFRQRFFTYEDKVYVMPDGLHFCIIDDRICVEESPRGFVIEVFDHRGNRLRTIEKPYDRIAVNGDARTRAFREYLEIPAFKRMIRERGQAFFDNFIKQQLYEYPDHFSPIQHILADDHILYVRTPLRRGNRESYQVLDLEGNVLQSVWLPVAKKVDFLVQMQGDKKYYTIHGGVYYHLELVETDEDEEWRLRREAVERTE